MTTTVCRLGDISTFNWCQCRSQDYTVIVCVWKNKSDMPCIKMSFNVENGMLDSPVDSQPVVRENYKTTLINLFLMGQCKNSNTFSHIWLCKIEFSHVRKPCKKFLSYMAKRVRWRHNAKTIAWRHYAGPAVTCFNFLMHVIPLNVFYLIKWLVFQVYTQNCGLADGGVYFFIGILIRKLVFSLKLRRSASDTLNYWISGEIWEKNTLQLCVLSGVTKWRKTLGKPRVLPHFAPPRVE